MANNKALELSIRIAGKVDKSLSAAVKTANGQVGALAEGLGKIGTVGLAAMGDLAAGGMAAIVDCTSAARDFESQMGDVVKYVSGLADETGKISDKMADNGRTYAENYKIAKETILDLSTQIPYTAEELTKLAAAAGQSGYTMDELFSYDAEGNIKGFLRDVAMWGTAMDVSADQAGDWAAKWEKAFSTPDMTITHEDVMEYADMINYLGANSPTTAAEIAEVVNDIAGLGSVAGADIPTVIAMADALLAVGVSGDNAATGLKRIMSNMSMGEQATKAMQEAWDMMGMDSVEVAKSMQEDAAGTLIDVMTAISGLEDWQRTSALKSLFGQWALESSAKMSQNLTPFITALEAVRNPEIYSGSMEREFIIKANTAESMNMMASNAWTALKAELGEAFLPVKKELALSTMDLIESLRKNTPELKRAAETLATILSNAFSRIGAAIEKGLPYLQKGLDYVADNPEKVEQTVGTLAKVFLAMKMAPAASKLMHGAGNLLLGKKETGGGRTGGLFGIGGLFGAAKFGAHMANNPSMTGAGLGGAGSKGLNSIIGGLFGMANRGKVFAAGATDAERWAAAMKMSGKIAGAKAFFPGIASALGSGATTAVGATAVGAGSVAGGIGGLIGIGSGIWDILKGTKSEGKDAKDQYFSGGTKIGMVGAGAAAGAGIGSLFAGIGAIPGALIGAGVGGVTSLFEGSKIGKMLSDATDEGGWINEAGKAINAFFTETLPEKWGSFWSGVGDFFTTSIPQWVSGVAAKAAEFFTVTIPQKWNDFWTSIGNFFTQTIPYAAGYSAGKIQNFLTITLPEKWEEFWGNVGTFFTETLPLAAQNLWNGSIAPFLFYKVPTFFEDLWRDVKTFWLETLPAAVQNLWSGTISPFIFNTVPDFFENLWGSVKTFATEELPLAAQNLWNGSIAPFLFYKVPNFFKDIWRSVKEFFNEGLPNIAKSIWASIKGFFTGTLLGFFEDLWGNISGSAAAGYNDATGNGPDKKAKGGFTHGISIAGEAGTEAVISFQQGVRRNNIATWMQAGRMLGVSAEQAAMAAGAGLRRFAAGGFTGPHRAVALASVGMRRAAPALRPIQAAASGAGQLVFSPQITINGNADRGTMESVMEDMRQRFEAWYIEMQRTRERTAY